MYFEVESLLSNVPIKGTVQAALRNLESGAHLADPTMLAPVQIADLLKFVSRSTVIANLYTEIFEEQAIVSAPCKPKIWKCCVEDTFAILDRDRVDILIQHLKCRQPSIRFTMEI